MNVRKGTENSESKFPVFFELLTKSHRGHFGPPSGRGLSESYADAVMYTSKNHKLHEIRSYERTNVL